jgi:hypothetical protein
MGDDEKVATAVTDAILIAVLIEFAVTEFVVADDAHSLVDIILLTDAT